MRIRKNTKLSSLLLATAGYSGERPETYNCHFNQSPWDVIPVTSSVDGDGGSSELLDSSWFLPCPLSSPPRSLIDHQFKGQDKNMSLRNCNGVAQRLKSVERLTAEDYETSPDVDEAMDRSDNSEIKSKSVEPNSTVETSGDEEQVAVSMPAPAKRGRPRGTGKKAPNFTAASTNPYEFYYYSGFGPRWGKKRGGTGDRDGEDIVMAENNNNIIMSGKKSSGSEEMEDKTASFGEGSISMDGFDYVDEDNNNDEESDHGRKKKKDEKTMMTKKKTKRGRKPVKERSLKSLM